MTMVTVKETEPFDIALRRFKRACEKAGVFSKLRQIERREKPTAKRKRLKAAAIKRTLKKDKNERRYIERRRLNLPKEQAKHLTTMITEQKSTTPIEATKKDEQGES